MDSNFTNLRLNDFNANVFLLLAIIWGLVILSGIIGNAFVLFVYVVRRIQEQRETRYFIPILALFDLLLCLLGAANILGNYIPYVGVFNFVFCKTSGFLHAFFMMGSNALLLTIAIQRYLKVCRPLGKQMNLFWRRFATLLITITSIIYAVPTLFVVGATTSNIAYNGTNVSTFTCTPTNNQYPTFQFVYYLALLGVGSANVFLTIGMYTPIMCAIYRHFNNRNIKQRPIHDAYTMTIKGKMNNIEQIAQTADEGAEKTEFGEDGVKIFEKHDVETLSPGRNVIQLNKTAKNQAKTATTNFTNMFFCIILIYAFSYIPTIITIIVLSQIQVNVLSLRFAWLRFLYGFYVINHAANPFVYAHYDMKIRKQILHFCKRWNRQ